MEMSDFRIINAPRDKVWIALNDPGILRQCVIGCDTLDRQDDGSLAAAMSVRVGPVSAKFKGKLTLQDVQAPASYTLLFEGNGGAAGFAKGMASVALSDEAPSKTRLAYTASSQIGGRLAQVGSRLIDAAARKIADDFFEKFAELVGSPEPAAAEGAAPGGADGSAVATPSGAADAQRWMWFSFAAALVLAGLYWVFK